MNILLTGANGFIGRHILQTLQQQNHHLIACCRQAEKIFFSSKNTQILQLNYADMVSEKDWLPHLKNIDVVINCVGIISESSKQSFELLHSQVPIALFKAAEKIAVKKIIQLSALGADDTAVSRYHLSKKSADDVLRELDLEWTILQPSIVYGEGAQSMALFHALASLPIQALIDGGQQLLQPVHIDDITATITQCINNQSPCSQTLALVGPETISFKQLLQKLRIRLGKKPSVEFSLSGKLAHNLSFIGQLLGEPTFSPENIAMLQQGNFADAKPITNFLCRPTHNLQQQLLANPATQAERWHAGLYFLKPLLRLSIAMLWLWSGIVSIFFYPQQLSYQFLAASHITGFAAPIMLYGLAFMDILLGLATLHSYHFRKLILLQLIIITLYTLTITFTLPAFWLHPFGPVLKNIPLLITLIVYLNLEGEKP